MPAKMLTDALLRAPPRRAKRSLNFGTLENSGLCLRVSRPAFAHGRSVTGLKIDFV